MKEEEGRRAGCVGGVGGVGAEESTTVALSRDKEGEKENVQRKK